MAKRRRRRIQIRVSDIYRYIVTGEIREIDGILQYYANKSHIMVRFEGRRNFKKYLANTEENRRKAVKEINKKIGENLHVAQ
jgi:hypothetical protein